MGERSNFRGMDEQEMKVMVKQQREKQDVMIGVFADTLNQIKVGQTTLSTGLQNDKYLLSDIENGMDINIDKTKKGNKAVLKLLNSKSDCSLVMIIVAEVVFLILQLVILP